MTLRDDARRIGDDLVRLRRQLHQIPEVGLDLPQTQRTVLDELAALPLEVQTGAALSSVTAVLRGGAPGPTVLLRGDMDALPVTERSGVDYAATSGAMHACGHDLHITMLVGAARLLSAARARIAGNVLFMFQPGEEAYDGAAHMLAEGLLDAAGDRPVVGYALHVASAMIPAGVFATRSGPFMAAAGRLLVTVRGAGGHGAMPHRAKDPVPALAEMVTALQVFATRSFDVFDPVVITVGMLQAGTAGNVIPGTATMEATLRAFSAPTQRRLHEGVVQVCRGVAAAHGLEADLTVDELYPPTVNREDGVAVAERVVTELFGAERFLRLPFPITGSEDFSRILDEVGGAMIFLGATAADRDPERAPFNHAPEAVFDDRVLADGAAMYAGLALSHVAQS